MNQVTKILKTNNYHLLRMTPKYSGVLNFTDNLISLLLTHLLIFYSKIMSFSTILTLVRKSTAFSCF